MLPPDLAFAQYVNQTSAAYTQHVPAYMTYRSAVHISVPRFNRTLDINRSVRVRVKDDSAIMQDLPSGAERMGQAFPIIAFFSPFQNFGFSYPAFMTGGHINRDFKITMKFGGSWSYAPPKSDTAVDATVFYIPYFMPSYASDATDANPHLNIMPSPTLPDGLYPIELQIDAVSGLPSIIKLRSSRGEVMRFEYSMIEGYWVIHHIAYDAISPTFIGDIKFNVDVTYDQFTFPASAPDPRLQ
ncbi:MAG: hypothetical protein ABR584_02210 [Candidatus Baltobacteraceae bacterium]